MDPRNTHETKFWTYEGTMARWLKTHDGTRPTKFITLAENKYDGTDNDAEEWRTQLETRVMEMEVNNVGQLEQLIHEIQTKEKEKEKEED